MPALAPKSGSGSGASAGARIRTLIQRQRYFSEFCFSYSFRIPLSAKTILAATLQWARLYRIVYVFVRDAILRTLVAMTRNSDM